MKPRLPSSKKWTHFPTEFMEQIEQVFNETFQKHLQDAKLIVEGRIYSEEIALRVGFLEKGRLRQNNFEVSMNYSRQNPDAVARIHNCIDAAASLMNEFFESDGEVDFPVTWKDYDFGGLPIWVQYTTDNSDLEKEANRLLGLEKEQLVTETAETEDALAEADEILPTEEGVNLLTPSMFSGKKRRKKEDLH